jgi:hypothetical protein
MGLYQNSESPLKVVDEWEIVDNSPIKPEIITKMKKEVSVVIYVLSQIVYCIHFWILALVSLFTSKPIIVVTLACNKFARYYTLSPYVYV